MTRKNLHPEFEDRPTEGRIEPSMTSPAPSPAEDKMTTATEASARLAVLEKELETAKASAAENLDKFLRAKAESENIRRRAEIDVSNAHKYGIERFAAEMLLVRDSLELAQGAEVQDAASIAAKVLEGAGLTLKLMDSALQKFGLSLVNPAIGDKFDLAKQQAVSILETAEMPPNHVMKVIQKGWFLNDRLLRPAMVVVSKAKAPA